MAEYRLTTFLDGASDAGTAARALPAALGWPVFRTSARRCSMGSTVGGGAGRNTSEYGARATPAGRRSLPERSRTPRTFWRTAADLAASRGSLANTILENGNPCNTADPSRPRGAGARSSPIRARPASSECTTPTPADVGWHPGLFLQEGEHIESVLLRGGVVVHGALDRPPRLACATSRSPLGSPNAAN